MQKKRTMGNKIQKPPSEDEKQEQVQIPEENEDDIFNFPQFEEHAEENRNKQLLDAIGHFVVNQREDKYRLTWQAFYSLKKKEIDMNKQMLDEINLVKDKYELKKQNIYTDISSVVLGQKVVNNPQVNNQTKNWKNIPDFWTVVFTKAGMLNDQISVDLDCFRKLESFTCEILENDFNYFKIRFTFKQEPIYFSNKELQICIKISSEEDQSVLQIKNPLKYKMVRVQQSFFTQIFDNSNLGEISALVTQINQSYRNSLYFYFSRYHSACTSQADNESNYYESSGKKIKSQPSSAEKIESSDIKILKN